MDLKQNWIGWQKYYVAFHERQAIIQSNSYRDLNAILQEHARKQCAGSDKPFHMPSTYWGSYVPAHAHSDYMLEGQMRASAIHSIYFAFERAFAADLRSTDKVTDPALLQIVTLLNSVPDAWPHTLARSPATIRNNPLPKVLADALTAADLSLTVYLDNLEALQKAYA